MVITCLLDWCVNMMYKFMMNKAVKYAWLIRTQTEALGGEYCDYWYVGDKSLALEQ
mgnify:CR=1 FL=1